MILNNAEKTRLIDSLTWMIKDMKFKCDETKGNLDEGSQGDYSPAVEAAVSLLEEIEKIETTEVTGCHRKSVGVNCREFKCLSNRQGSCALAKITLEKGSAITIGNLKCVQAEEQDPDGEA